jgi:uncharacterized protein YfaS (alpha-2-macroglobulin family)
MHELLCWRMLPVVPSIRGAFQEHVNSSKAADPKNPWTYVFELCLVTADGNRPALLATLQKAPAALPTSFPGAFGERKHFDLLQELGQSRLEAALNVIAARDYEPLHALRDLDRALTREADALQSADRPDDAKLVRSVRERLRQSYLRSAKHLVEKLFALHLAGQSKERDALLAKAKALPYLHDRQHLANLLERMDEEQAWASLLEPMLNGELALIDHPPNLERLPARSVASMHIRSRTKDAQGDTIHYVGAVRVRMHGIEIACDKLSLVQSPDPAAVVLTGNGRVQLRGMVAFPGGILADRFVYHAETCSFTLGGDIRLKTHEHITKLRACTLTARGELRDRRSLLDDFEQSFTLTAKFETLGKIAAVYDDAELPDPVRYWLALHLLRPQMTWHAPYLPAQPNWRERELIAEQVKVLEGRGRDETSPWQEAHGGEAWMHGAIPVDAEVAFRASLKRWYQRYNDEARKRDGQRPPPDFPIPGKDLYFWRLRDPRHPDVARAARLFEGIRSEDLLGKARQWAQEVRRNNTILTFDIAGGAPVGRTHSLLMDTRNAETVSFKLYRVKKPEELVYATRKVGSDFIFRDHHLDDPHGKLREIMEKTSMRDLRKRAHQVEEHDKPVSWTTDQLVRAWSVRVEDLPHHHVQRDRYSWRRYRDRDWHDEADAHYFDDECSEHHERIEKSYRPRNEHQLSSWQCDRVVSIPEKALSEAGAYVLVAEANGQAAHVPIVVEPISLTLRRCRDGVFVLAADADGMKPLAGATVHARGQRHGNAWNIGAETDKEGVAFARVLAFGDRPLIVHHQGRYAIGGFGQVFEGIYEPGFDELDRAAVDRLKHAKRGEAKEMSAAVYEDRHVVIAYTDRPTYRPGQEVQFKLIVRRLLPEKLDEASAKDFRAQEFDARTKMVLPDLEQMIRYAVLDPKGHAIADGSLKLGEFGTAAGSFKLNDENAIGTYSMRVHVAGQPRIAPEVFAVKHYRRPNFEVKLTGVPETLAKPDTLHLDIASRYYFGPPVAKGAVAVRVVTQKQSAAIAEADGTLDEQGKTRIEVRLPKSLTPGKLLVVTTVTDESGRTVSATAPLKLQSPDATVVNSGLDTMPRFVAVGAELPLKTTAKEIVATQAIETWRFAAKNGIATLRFRAPGWYHLQAGDDESAIFAYGGDQHPLNYSHFGPHPDDAEWTGRAPKWVNLSDFAFEDHGHESRWERPSRHIYALFDQQSLKVGDKLRFLIYMPYKKAKMLFTFESRTVLDYSVVWSKDVGGAYQVVELPMKDRYHPNVYVQGRVLAFEGERVVEARQQMEMRKALERLDEDGADPRWCRIDVAKPAGTIEGGLNVQIKPDRASYRPGDLVRATVQVTDRAGKPQSAEVSFGAVDESVYVFGEDRLDALAGFFHAPYEARRFQPKAWRVSLGERWTKKGLANAQQHQRDAMAELQRLSKQLLEMAHGEAKMGAALPDLRDHHLTTAPLPRLGGEMPAAQLPLARLREHFHETAAWLPQLRTDASGTAYAAFTLPDSLTRYRLTSVALTKTTDVGVGRAHITAGLPLAVQVFVPRFGIEKDRLQAIALIHNSTDQERECAFTWTIDGAMVETPGETTGRIKASAKGSVKVGVWLKLDRLGTARIAFRAAAGVDTDAEVRTLPVQPLGRPAEVNVNNQLAPPAQAKPAEKVVVAKFNKEGRIQLPAGFVATELDICLAATDVGQALSGLDYLVDYPYGCIEQTMSRFLPAVMVKHAARHSPVTLSPEIAAKLPDILDKGLTRLYGHQHADGSWGWFEKDSRNLAMSVYVVYGLARCQATGTKVDREVLRRGCEYLLVELRTGKHEPDLIARAWHALALAGHLEAKELETAARKTLGTNPGHAACCDLALACRAAGLAELGEQFWKKARGWQPQNTDAAALWLNTQIAFGASFADCRQTAARLLSQRTGTFWSHTRDTSWAIEALANMLGYAPEKHQVREIEVKLAGKAILSVKKADELKKMLWRVHLTANQLPAQDGLEITMKADGNDPIHVAVRAVGVQRLDGLAASGKRVRLERRVETLDGEALKGPLKIGQVVRVRLRLDLADPQRFLMIEDRRPSLCEFADDALAGRSAKFAVNQEFRDDRVCVFLTSLDAGSHEILYYLRAETPGTCSVLPGCAYPMYEPATRGGTAGSKVEVR